MPSRDDHLKERPYVPVIAFAFFVILGHWPAALAVASIAVVSKILPDLDWAPPQLQHPRVGKRNTFALSIVSNTKMIPPYCMLVGAGVFLPFVKAGISVIVALGAFLGLLLGIVLVRRVVHRGWAHTLQAGVLVSACNAVMVANFCDFAIWILRHSFLWDPIAWWILIASSTFLVGLIGYHSHLALDGVPLTRPRVYQWVHQ